MQRDWQYVSLWKNDSWPETGTRTTTRSTQQPIKILLISSMMDCFVAPHRAPGSRTWWFICCRASMSCWNRRHCRRHIVRSIGKLHTLLCVAFLSQCCQRLTPLCGDAYRQASNGAFLHHHRAEASYYPWLTRTTWMLDLPCRYEVCVFYFIGKRTRAQEDQGWCYLFVF